MKIGIRGGHNPSCPGASALSVGGLDELAEDRKVKDAVIKYLIAMGHSVVDCTPGGCDQNTDLAFGVNTAENAKVDLFFSIHFNKAYESYNGSIGSEVWANPNNSNGVTIANRILGKLQGLGFKNRGVKDGVNGEHLYEVRKPSMTSFIIEVCFVEALGDVQIYRNIGYDAIGKAIAEGVVGQSVQASTPAPTQTVNQATVQSGQYGIVTADVLNVRSGRGTNYPVIGQVKRGTKLKIDQKMGDWYSVYFGQHGGFVSAQYIQI